MKQKYRKLEFVVFLSCFAAQQFDGKNRRSKSAADSIILFNLQKKPTIY